MLWFLNIFKKCLLAHSIQKIKFKMLTKCFPLGVDFIVPAALLM